MATEADVAATLLESAADGIAESEGDGHRVKAHPLPDMIAADRYLNANAGAGRKTFGLRFVKLVPPGTTS